MDIMTTGDHPAGPGDPQRPGPVDAAAELPPELAALARSIRRLARTSVMVIGDVMLDRYIYGAVERISPEAPIPILAVESERSMPGGAGNVVRNLTALGAAVAFVSIVGDDQAGSDLTGLIGVQPGVEPWLLVHGGRATTVKTRYVSNGQQLLRADREETGPIPPKLAERMLRIAGDTLAATSIAILSDYRKGVLSGTIPAQLIAAAKAAGRQVVVDPQGPDYSRYAGADVVTPNRRKLAEATNMPVDTEAAIVSAATALRNAHGFGAVLVTRAAEGMTLVDAEGAHHFPAEAADVFDVSGAGDAVVATLAAGLAAGLELKIATRIASMAAGIVVGKIGPAVAREADLLAALSPPGGTLRKVVTREAAAEQIERWRRKGWRTGLTNGVFDTAQPGDIHRIEQARGQCDRLVVAIAANAGGASAAALANLPAIDLVVIFEEATPEETLDILRPEILIKGADDPLDAGMVQEWGGRVWIADPL